MICNKKTKCVCHENKLQKSYEHDTECCKNMNGFLVSLAPWEIEFDAKFPAYTWPQNTDVALIHWIKDFIHFLLQAEQEAIIQKIEEYLEHRYDCIRAGFTAGKPTASGGYEQKFGGKWYQSSPIDKTPKCGCGLSDIVDKIKQK